MASVVLPFAASVLYHRIPADRDGVACAVLVHHKTRFARPAALMPMPGRWFGKGAGNVSTVDDRGFA